MAHKAPSMQIYRLQMRLYLSCDPQLTEYGVGHAELRSTALRRASFKKLAWRSGTSQSVPRRGLERVCCVVSRRVVVCQCLRLRPVVKSMCSDGSGSSTPSKGSSSMENSSRPRCVSVLALLLVWVCVSSGEVSPCGPFKCSVSLQKTLQITRILHKETGGLLKIYKANQGEGVEFMCQAQAEGVPEATISGQDWTERLTSINARLREFAPHLQRVAEQQSDLQPPGCPLLATMERVQARASLLLRRENCLLREVLPNSVLEPPSPTTQGGHAALPPPLNTFQQKTYGCSVLTRLRAFLSASQKELKALKGVACKRRTELLANRVGSLGP
ncbi:IL-6 subfamily cytokine M17 [Engraulis encrasicolus]|uniref:IL-6 subfamily cytokine M17 n=1 Tax=Engraulis encrasicolus TaxID=184585 RepID=UPI002FD51048